MSEQTPTAHESETPLLDEAWKDNQFIQRSSEASRAIFNADQQAAVEAQAAEKKNKIIRGVTKGVIATTAVVGAGAAIYEANKGPEFSEITNEYVVQPGDGLYDAAQDIEGIDGIDIRDAVHHIEVDPANIDVLSDGLQPGEVLIIPKSVE